MNRWVIASVVTRNNTMKHCVLSDRNTLFHSFLSASTINPLIQQQFKIVTKVDRKRERIISKCNVINFILVVVIEILPLENKQYEKRNFKCYSEQPVQIFLSRPGKEEVFVIRLQNRQDLKVMRRTVSTARRPENTGLIPEDIIQCSGNLQYRGLILKLQSCKACTLR